MCVERLLPAGTAVSTACRAFLLPVDTWIPLRVERFFAPGGFLDCPGYRFPFSAVCRAFLLPAESAACRAFCSRQRISPLRVERFCSRRRICCVSSVFCSRQNCCVSSVRSRQIPADSRLLCVERALPIECLLCVERFAPGRGTQNWNWHCARFYTEPVAAHRLSTVRSIYPGSHACARTGCGNA